MTRKAFTLVELLVVIAIIGLLSTVAVVSTSSARVNSRNAWRKATLTQLAKALELYYANNGAYPSTGGANQGYCNGQTDSGAGSWIPNFTPTYMATLPHDPRTGVTGTACGVYTCFLYRSDGVDYKVIANCLPEGSLSASDPFYDPVRPAISWAIYTPGGINW